MAPAKQHCLTVLPVFIRPTRGDVVLTARDGSESRLNGLKPDQVTAKGMARTFQNIRLFQNMTVLENVMIGRHCRMRTGIPGAVLRPPRARAEEKKVIADSYQILEKFALDRHVNEFAKKPSLWCPKAA